MRWVWRYRLRRTTLWLVFFLAVLGGLGLARAGLLLGASWSWVNATILAFTLRGRTALAGLAVVMLGLSIGCQRGAVFMDKLAAYQPLYYHKIIISAQATEDAVYGTNSQLSFDANNVYLDDGTRLAGKIAVSGFGLNGVFQGDEVQVSGKLYPGYGAYQGRLSFAQLVLIEQHPSLVAETRRKFAAGMQSALPEPLASFAMGLLIGQRATLPANVKQDLLMVGLTHIIAVSGYNLTIMLHASKGLFARRSKRIATLLSLILIGLFLLLAGASASIVRAAIVSVLSIAASYYGRRFKPLNLIMLAAAITAWANPFYIWSDVSWYLSFLAFFGVLVLAPLAQKRWLRRWHDSLVVGVALESLCAETMTLPFVLYTFGQMSFIGLPANVLVVTLVPLAMLLSLVAGLAGMLAGSIAGWLAWPARLLLTYMLDVAHVLARIPHVFVQHLGLSLAQMLGLYVLPAGLATLLWGKTRALGYAKITDRNEVTSEAQTGEWSQQMVND
ncbi:MAG TPA: ComEC/Rec2 family competence protein [Verrucomicrobiae bacterium]|jgi:ComEC/Rec2-related protein|nr:ComEC/Rec2 family competence protein [Verrucomicrobiae bacterium]